MNPNCLLSLKYIQKTLASTMDSVISLMIEVESKEKTAKQAKAEAGMGGLDVFSKAEELKQAQQCVKETNGKHATEVYEQKVVLATDTELLHIHMNRWIVCKINKLGHRI